MATSPRALFIAPATPARTGNGLAMRLGLFRDALSRVADVDTLVLPVSGPPPEAPLGGGGETFTIPVAGRTDTQFLLLSRTSDADERLRQFKQYGRGSRHAALSMPVLADVRRAIAGQHYDLVHVGRLYLAETAVDLGATISTLDLDEDDAWAWRRLAATQPSGEAAWSMAEAEAEDRLLGRLGSTFDARFISGPADQKSLSGRFPGLDFELVANAIAFPQTTARRDDGNTVLFVGAFGYQPNVEGVLWFVRQVWPRIREATDARLRLVGRDMPEQIRQLAMLPGIEVLGAVDDVSDAYAEATVAIAPLRTGAGTRVKLIEAAAHLVPMVSTSLAARGLDFATPETMWIADAPAAFADAVLSALASPKERDRRAGAAHRLAKPAHDRTQVVDKLASRFAGMLASGASKRGRQ